MRCPAHGKQHEPDSINYGKRARKLSPDARDNGPEGLIKGKKAYLVVARGGNYSQGPMRAFNFQDTYLKTTLGFIGITDVEVIAVEGIAFGPEVAEKAFNTALARVDAVPHWS